MKQKRNNPVSKSEFAFHTSDRQKDEVHGPHPVLEQYKLSQVLEAPSLLENSSSAIEQGSVIKPSGIDHDSFYDLSSVGASEGPEEEADTEDGREAGREWHLAELKARREKLNARHSGVGSTLVSQASYYTFHVPFNSFSRILRAHH